MKKAFLLCWLAMAPVFAGNAAPATKSDRAERRQAGIATRRTEGGAIAFIDTRGNVESGVGEVARRIQDSCGLVVMCQLGVDGKATSAMKQALDAVASSNVAVAVSIAAEGSDRPALTVCPEEGVAVINVDRLGENLPGENANGVFHDRVMTEMWRAVAFVLGGYDSGMPCAFSVIRRPQDIDNLLIHVVSPPILAKIVEGAVRYDVARIETEPYEIAVRKGWAPPPTNDVQKAIWERVKAARAASSTNAPAATPSAAK